MLQSLLTLLFILALGGCSTTGVFKIPKGSQLELYGRHIEVPDSGIIVTKPFFWTAAGGVPYRLLDKTGAVIKEGKARAKFRVVSIFWPPFALIYWPMGLNGQVTNDLTENSPAAEQDPNKTTPRKHKK